MQHTAEETFLTAVSQELTSKILLEEAGYILAQGANSASNVGIELRVLVPLRAPAKAHKFQWQKGLINLDCSAQQAVDVCVAVLAGVQGIFRVRQAPQILQPLPLRVRKVGPKILRMQLSQGRKIWSLW